MLGNRKAIARVFGNDDARRRGAPPPSTTRRGIMHVREAAASTYAFRLVPASPRPSVRRSDFKIGWAFDVRSRARTFNQVALPELGGLHYVIHLFQPWDHARQAFAMEQLLLSAFDARRHRTNREVVTDMREDELASAWAACLDLVRSTGRRPCLRRQGS